MGAMSLLPPHTHIDARNGPGANRRQMSQTVGVLHDHYARFSLVRVSGAFSPLPALSKARQNILYSSSEIYPPYSVPPLPPEEPLGQGGGKNLSATCCLFVFCFLITTSFKFPRLFRALPA